MIKPLLKLFTIFALITIILMIGSGLWVYFRGTQPMGKSIIKFVE